MLISRALALRHTLLNINDKVNFPPWSSAAGGCGSGRSAAFQNGLHCLRTIAVPQRGAAPAGGPLLTGEPEREDAAPPVNDLDPGLLQQGEKGGKIGGVFRKCGVYGDAKLLLKRGPAVSPSHSP